MERTEAQELDLLRQDIGHLMRKLKEVEKNIIRLMPEDFRGPRKKITRAMLNEAVRKKYANDEA
jgi:hypothetical protein